MTGDAHFFQCGLSNDPRAERCPRCRTWKSPGGPPRGRCSFDDRERHSEDDRGRDGKDDHYGPPSRGVGGGRRGREDDYDDQGDRRDRPSHKKPRGEPRKREWPPQFEGGGASFIFDARSGMFYEPSSDFFYDPKTKLYYSNKKQQYFRYDEEKKPYTFQPVGARTGRAVGCSSRGQVLKGGLALRR